MKKLLVIGSGPIIIGQACEFDYSGVQVCKIFKRNNIKVILLNNNPATIMTDKNICHKIYMEDINLENLKKIILKENIKYLYPCSGGQTALNLAINISKENKINLMGTSIKSILNAESRSIFRRLMKKNKIRVSLSYIAKNINYALKIRKKIIRNTNKKEISIRPSYTLGGLGGSLVNNLKSFINNYNKCLLISGNNEVIIEESLYGYKEIELEILKDKYKNFIVVCCIENIDPVGIHTGDSVCVSPLQTLTDKEYQYIRSISKKIIKILKIKKTGANLQFAINPNNGKYFLIEVNPRLSRSSALASKATSYPIAAVSAEISLGKKISNLKNFTIKDFVSYFEPNIDYNIIKYPIFSHEKFFKNNEILNNQMKSVGEIMSISKNLERSIQLSINNDNHYGFDNEVYDKINLFKKIYYANNKRLINIFELIKQGFSIKKISIITKIDLFFIKKIYNIVKIENKAKKSKNLVINKNLLKDLKINGFSDIRISKIISLRCKKLIHLRKKLSIIPSFIKADGCSNEYENKNNYYYSEYFCKNEIKNYKTILIIGSGPNKIGQGIEFDYCCVHALNFLKKNKIGSSVLNNNPETVSTDFNSSDILYFLPVYFESIFDIYLKSNIKGLILQFCGQVSNYLLKKLITFKINVLGTNLKNIVEAEDRKIFFNKIYGLDIIKPENQIVKKSLDFVKLFNNKFPFLIRPSFVLGGKDMKIINSESQLRFYYKKFIVKRSINYPITVDKYLKNSIEIDVDGISNKKKTFIFPLLQQIEKTGIHSGDSCSFFPTLLGKKLEKKIIIISKKISSLFKIIGSFNIQYSFNTLNKSLYLLELNPRASRSVPFLSKSTNIDITYYSMKSIIFNNFKNFNIKNSKFFYAKEPIFCFEKYKNSFLNLGPEMKSTGEIIVYSKNIKEFIFKIFKNNYKININFDKIFIIGNIDLYFLKKIRKNNIKFFLIKNFKQKYFIFKNFLRTLVFMNKKNKKINNIFLQKIKYYKIPFLTDINRIYFFLLSNKNKYYNINSINVINENNKFIF
ncbi:carbamoyl-phosphate synthase large subunit [Candidatus Vidania fulgoroideorum]